MTMKLSVVITAMTTVVMIATRGGRGRVRLSSWQPRKRSPRRNPPRTVKVELVECRCGSYVLPDQAHTPCSKCEKDRRMHMLQPRAIIATRLATADGMAARSPRPTRDGSVAARPQVLAPVILEARPEPERTAGIA